MFDAIVVKLVARVVNSAPDAFATDDDITVVAFNNNVAFVGIMVDDAPPPHSPSVAALTAQAGNSLSPK